MNTPLRVVQYGLGPIGQATARTVLEKQESDHLELVGALDVDPDKVGRDVADLVGIDNSTGIVVSDDPTKVLETANPDVVLHTTTSFLEDVADQLIQCAGAGAHVVSSTEELSFPYQRYPSQSDMLDRTAQEAEVTFVGTGVNPGYAMDTLPLMATGVCTDVSSVHVQRVVDAGNRRGPLQDKVGAGLTVDAFAEKKAAGGFGHIGLRESLWMVAEGLGWMLDTIEETLEPVRADRAIDTGHRTVEKGEVAGIHHAATGFVDGTERLSLDLKMYVGAENPRDAVQVEGNPPIDLAVQNGIFGDTATVGMLINTIPLAAKTSPGLKTMMDLPVPRAFGTQPDGSGAGL